MSSVSRYSTQLTVPGDRSNSYSKRFDSRLMYLEAGYTHTVGGLSTRHEYQHSLLPTPSKKPTKRKP